MSKVLSCVLLISVCFVTNLVASALPETGNNGNFQLVGHIGGETNAIFFQDNYAYVGEGYSLVVVDIIDPTDPTVVGKSPLLSQQQEVEDIAVVDSIAYVVNGSHEVLIIDVSDPTKLNIVGRFNTDDAVSNLYVINNTLYIAMATVLLKVDVSDPVNLSLVRSYEHQSSSDVMIHPSEEYAYIFGTYGLLSTIDLNESTRSAYQRKEQPNSPQSRVAGLNGKSIQIDGDYLYSARSDYFSIYDINDPANPFRIDVPNRYGKTLDVIDNIGYIATQAKLEIVDFNNPDEPVQIIEYDAQDLSGEINPTIIDIYIEGDYVYLAHGRDSGFTILDISIPATPTPTFVGSYRGLADSRGLHLVDGMIAVSESTGGLTLVDTTDPLTPLLLDSYELAGYFGEDVEIVDNYAYVADGLNDLIIFDISDQRNVVEVGRYVEECIIRTLDIVDNYAYLACEYGGVKVIDISDPTIPQFVSEHDRDFEDVLIAVDIEVVGSYAYVANLNGSFDVIDFTDVMNPVLASSYDTVVMRVISEYYGYSERFGESVLQVEIVGNHAYVANGDNGVLIFDLSDPQTPTLTSSFLRYPEIAEGTSETALDVVVVGEYMYVADHVNGVYAVDITDLSNPVFAGIHDIPGRSDPVSIASDGEYIYVATDYSGIHILEFTSTLPLTVNLASQTARVDLANHVIALVTVTCLLFCITMFRRRRIS